MPWDRPLTRELFLSDGRKLKTLRDAARLSVERFESVQDAPPLRRAIELLMQAAASGSPRDLEAATDQVADGLRIWRMIE
jgi:hypothetical protein